MNTPSYISILSQPLAFWIANCNANNVPEVVRCYGVAPIDSPEQLTIFIPEIWSAQFVANLGAGKKVTLSGTSVPTYESYQYKGEFLSIRACTEDEMVYQHQYMDKFSDEVEKIGLPKLMCYNAFFHQPSLAVTFRLMEVFDQAPHKGTGIQLNKREATNE
ncbi:hypothetical protein A3860_19910 [Niastella vici]|uniref:Pyridoxamine 5'-phosphate oxidase putative domain-containing protein n=1 Tax=Niastella vici TaxID=1703345 RepID=A0A1V9G0T8_9BACT|nr:hypothetical protein [Niastella vici]OQP64245.1 hypothetical protein A3860_19910 [Niastella vici]